MIRQDSMAGGRKHLLVVAALIVSWLAATAWMRPLMLPDEGRYVGVAWEMMRSGDWLTPTLDGLPFFHKPPLFYWITAGAMSLWGPHEGPARIASILGASMAAWSLYGFTRRWSGEKAARATLVALLVQPLFFFGGQFANLDMLVAGCISTTILLLAHASLCMERRLPHRGALAAAYAFAAFGVLAKGLIGFVIPGLVATTWLIATRRWRMLPALAWWPGAALFLVLAAPWFFAMQARFPGFLDYFFVVQHFKRFAGTGFNNVQPFWFYPALLAFCSLPWLPWIRRSLHRPHADGEGEGAVAPSSVRWLMLCWIGCVVLFFSTPQSKLIGYILPAVPPLAALMAEGFYRRGVPSLRAMRLWWGAAALAGLLDVGAVLGLTFHAPKSLNDLASALAQRHGSGEPVFMLGEYHYDLPFYARLSEPVRVVGDWSDAEIDRHDNWRKELADAGRFSPALAAEVLVSSTELDDAAACRAQVMWIIGGAQDAGRFAPLRDAEVVARQNGSLLWRLVPGRSGFIGPSRCERRPNADSASK